MHTHITSSKRIAIFTHTGPDGDAIGSTIGLAAYIKSKGMDFNVYYPDEPAASLGFIIPDELQPNVCVYSAEKDASIKEQIKRCDLLIGLDFNVLDRIGAFAPIFAESKAFKILADHHVGPQTESFDLVFSQPSASSACELLYHLMLEFPDINGKASAMPGITREALLTGMTTDTNNFANSATPSTFRMAADLIEAGTDRNAILQKLYFSYPQRKLEAEGYMLDKLLHITEEGVAYAIIDRRTQRKFGLQEGDTEGFVNLPLALENVRMSVLFKREAESDRIRVSVRSKKGTSARQFAMKYFNGGGHEQASGGRLNVGTEISRMSELASYVEKCIAEFFMEQ